MDKNDVMEWCDSLRKAWLSKDFSKIETIFSHIQTYYEDPFSIPGTTSDHILSYWDEIIYQNINCLNISPIAIDSSRAIIRWFLDYIDTRDSINWIMDGIYQVDFDSDGRCINFIQWWVVKE